MPVLLLMVVYCTIFHLFSLLNGHEACELGHNRVLLTNVDDVRLAISLQDLTIKSKYMLTFVLSVQQ